MKQFSLLFPSTIHFGFATLDKVATIKMPEGSIGLVTGGAAMRKNGSIDRVLGLLKNKKVIIFEGVEPEVSVETVDKCAKTMRKHGVTSLIGIGGGSALDCAKAVAGVYKSGKSVKDYLDGKIKISETAFFIAIPSTAGTGAEVTKNAVLTYTEKKIKTSLRGETLVPKIVICDPQLTMSMPPEITAYTGMDALTHAVESYFSTGANEVTKGFAVKAIKLIMENILKAVENGSNKTARYNMLLASVTAGLAFANSGLGAVHGIGHPVGAIAHLSHGKVNAILLPVVMECHKKYASGLFKSFEKDCGENTIKKIKTLNKKIGLPDKLSKLDSDIAAKLPLIMSTMVYASGSMAFNPVKMTPSKVENILKEAL
ncbi:MAG: iron-containing alcohol dehydrogenase [bacterium]